jgi:rubrerythrin
VGDQQHFTRSRIGNIFSGCKNRYPNSQRPGCLPGRFHYILLNSIRKKGELMSYDFNADEIFEMAEQLERNGAKFYTDAAKADIAPSHKALLLKFAAMEVEHEKTFKKLRDELNVIEKESTVFDPQGEASMYLRALADTRVFFEKQIDLSSIKEILKSAIEAEKDSIVFYLGMKEAVPKNLGKGKIDDIIKEEMGHIRLLSKELVTRK